MIFAPRFKFPEMFRFPEEILSGEETNKFLANASELICGVTFTGIIASFCVKGVNVEFQLLGLFQELSTLLLNVKSPLNLYRAEE